MPIKKTFRYTHLLGAAATGIYGSQTSETIYSETSISGNDFLAEVCLQWEAELQKMEKLNMRTVVLRTGIVLGKTEVLYKRWSHPFDLEWELSWPQGNNTCLDSSQRFV